MHLLARETRSLDEEAEAADLGQSPADLVFLSFSDSDLGAMAAAWERLPVPRPSLRLANLARLRHPMSVDLYAEQVIARARCVVVRLLGGLDYWRYGAEEFAALCRASPIALALLPGDGRADARLADLSTVPEATRARLDACLSQGGPDNLRLALGLCAHLAGLGDDPGVTAVPVLSCGTHKLPVPETGWASAVIVFYRSHLLAGDIAPVEALAAALAARGIGVRALFAGSLKEQTAAAFVAERLRDWRPDVVLNATSFSARSDESGAGSPLDAADAPVLQLVLSGASRAAWAESSRGLSQADLAMHVVLPELDGRLLTTAISFKAETGTEEALEYARVAHRPDADGIALAAARAEGWARLRRTPAAERRLAIVLPDYPGAGGQAGRAVGLDGFASLAALLRQLGESGYDIGNVPPDAEALANALCRGPGDGSSPGGVRGSAPGLCLPHYRTLLEALPQTTRAALEAAWGPPEDDPAVADGVFPFPCLRTGRMLLAIQPDRGSRLDRKSGYHDPDLPPRHAYVAFHLWLRQEVGVHALVQLGAHGSLEWLPGKAAALSPACFPAALIGGLPVIYPFIVNNPGEAAAAKRRLGAVTIGHLTPPLRSAGTHGEAAALERLIDEYAAADGLDRRRTALLRREILERADAAGLIEESGASGLPEDDALARLDAWLCDIKDMQIRDGLHVFGQAPDAPRRAALLDALARSCPGLDPAMLATQLDACAAAERDALRAALDGRFVPAGPAGAPTRGRADVLPTGRNLHAVDPRAIPTRSALALAERAAAELLRRHVQETGDWPRSLVLDLWGSTTMRTGGEDLALALVLIGARPVWDAGSARVSGFEILPLATLDRPRVDVTLRVSGLFRDAFPAQIALFDAAVRAVAARDEAVEWNKLAAACRGLDGAALRRASTRIYGAAPGAYGAGVADEITRGAWARREELGASYLAASSAAYGKDLDGIADAEGFAARVATAGGFVHLQDQAGTDLLDGLDQATHTGGFAAAAQALGGARDGAAALYQLDISATETPRARTLTEAVARAVRGRAANPAWIAGMRRHGHQGAAEIAGALEALHAFAATLPGRLDRQYDQIFAATLADPAVERFLREANPAAHAAMRARFAEARRRGLWHSRRNDVAALLDDAIADDIPPKGHTMTEATS